MPKLPLFFLLFASAAQAASLTLSRVDHQPAVKNLAPEIGRLREAIARDPKNRAHRLALVGALRRSGQLAEALAEARAWRSIDAYNLVVVRLIGDLNADLGRKQDAQRAYSAVVELVPHDAPAHRALATVLKQNGDLENAYTQLLAAEKLNPEDRRIVFELADTAHRLGKIAEAKRLFERVAEVKDQIGYPARQRLERMAGGVANDIKIYLTWDTDKSDVDLWVTNPRGEKIFYGHKQGAAGESLHDDVTSGYGPESFTARTTVPGTYTVEVNYFSGGRSALDEARGEVVVVLHEGQSNEQRHVLPYRLFEPKQVLTVAHIRAGGGK